ncbi:hypothetical protein GRX01_15855 [Halobaculum sp. WSA2]|uniref:histidine kinase n=1 Tax=Halobaculum saliterrae TaxID=2073113 RepID=A0A6B0SW16_9EURY|nr:HAMP domain-containing sensor histidine kinase [Halobaculum saliterrae]MXR42807.1 hypothetical protein [Halobaculum saliterrae]
MSGSGGGRWGAVVAVGAASLAAAHIAFLFGASSTRGRAAALVSFALAVAVCAFGVLLWRRGPPRRAAAVGRGVVAGVAVGAAVFVLAVRAANPDGVPTAALPRMATDLLTLGAAAGAVIGRTRARFVRERGRAEALFANLPSPAAYVDNSGETRRILATNAAFESTFDGRPGDALVDAIPVADDGPTLAAALGADGPVEVRTPPTSNGGPREVVVRSVRTGSADREYVIATDVTDDRRRERRLSVLNRVLRHDVRSGVNVIVGHAEAFAESGDPDDFRALRRRADRLVSLSKRGRDLDRILSGDVPEVSVDLAALAAERADAFAAAGNRVDCRVPDTPVPVVDNGYLGAAIDELLANVAEHAAPDPTARVRVRSDGDVAVLRIEDDGSGIPPSERTVLERGIETDLEHASGVGLWFVTWTVAELGGDVSVESDDSGTSVSVTLPAATGSDRPSPPPDTAISAAWTADDVDRRRSPGRRSG